MTTRQIKPGIITCLVLMMTPVLLFQAPRLAMVGRACTQITRGGEAAIQAIEAHKERYGAYPDEEIGNELIPEDVRLTYYYVGDKSTNYSYYIHFYHEDPFSSRPYYTPERGHWSHHYDWIYRCGEVYPPRHEHTQD